MQYIELAPGIKSSAIAFGCAPIRGAVSQARAQRAIDVALEQGVTHFDLARSYGYGQAEKAVGKILGARRQRVVIASKFGIEATPQAKLMQFLKPVVRGLRSLKNNKKASSPASGSNNLGALNSLLIRRLVINEKNMRISLEKSLQNLKTDCIDHFFVHEPEGVIQNSDLLFERAEQLKREGKIRAFGLASPSENLHLHRDYLKRFDVVQLSFNPQQIAFNEVVNEKPTIFFSVNRSNPSSGDRAGTLKTILQTYPQSVVILSMFTPKHILQNCAQSV